MDLNVFANYSNRPLYTVEFGRRRHGHTSHTERFAHGQRTVHGEGGEQGGRSQMFFARDRQSHFDVRLSGQVLLDGPTSPFRREIRETIVYRDVSSERLLVDRRNREIRVHRRR